MPDAEDRRRRNQPVPTDLETAFEPEAVAPDEVKRRDPTASHSPRDIVELTSPIGHRLRVPPPSAEAHRPELPPQAPRKPNK